MKTREEHLETFIEQATSYFNSLYKEVTVRYENENFIIDGTNEEEMQKVATELSQMLKFSKL